MNPVSCPPIRALSIFAGALVMATALSLAPRPAAATEEEGRVDLELVLAVDASSSVSEAEFELQSRGLATAFRDPAIAAAIRASGDLGIAVSLMQWSDSRKQSMAVGWHRLTDAESTAAFADKIEQMPRFFVGGSTAIGGAIQYALKQMDGNDFEGRRKVIDISGDGRTNQGAQPARLRDEAVANGVTINGLAILNEDPLVDGYYLYHVIGGTGAFVMTATDYRDFFKAMLEKLIKEISGVPLVLDQDPAGSGITVQEALLEEKLPSSIDLQ